MKILISDAFNPALPAKLEAFGEVTDDKSRLVEVDAVLVRSKTQCTSDYIDEAKNLRLIIRGGVGLDEPSCSNRPITNCQTIACTCAASSRWMSRVSQLTT